MTDSGNVPELQDLEPLDAGSPASEGAAGPSLGEATLHTLRSGMPPPAFNPMCGDKAYYRFLMCGVFMLIGCLMPFTADLQQVGYKTMSGAIYTFIALGMVWTWWAAIHYGRSSAKSLKWLALCMVPIIGVMWSLMSFDALQSLIAAKDSGWLPGRLHLAEDTYSWGNFFGDVWAAIGKKSPEASERVEVFLRLFGCGKIFVLLGAVFAELFFVAGIFGGAKQNKMQKVARQSQAAERKRR